MINISFIKLKGKVTDNYLKTLKGWANKDITWEDIHKPMSSSKVQYSCYAWKNGVKKSNNFTREKQDCFILDIDDGMTINEFQSLFNKYKYILGTTKTHQKEKKGIVCDRFRVIVPAINISQDDSIYFRAMELIAPFNDVQTLTKTASFLGNNSAIIIRNDGKLFDMFKANELAIKQLKAEQADKVVIDKDLLPSYGNSSLESTKSELTRETVTDILNNIGVDVVGNKCKLRDDERTHSVKIYPDGGMYDFGDRKAYDIFSVLQERESMTFREAINYVRNFI